MKYDVNFSKYLGEHEMLNDVWKWERVEADNEKGAMNKLLKKHNKNGKCINYFLTCIPIEE